MSGKIKVLCWDVSPDGKSYSMAAVITPDKPRDPEPETDRSFITLQHDEERGVDYIRVPHQPREG